MLHRKLRSAAGDTMPHRTGVWIHCGLVRDTQAKGRFPHHLRVCVCSQICKGSRPVANFTRKKSCCKFMPFRKTLKQSFRNLAASLLAPRIIFLTNQFSRKRFWGCDACDRWTCNCADSPYHQSPGSEPATSVCSLSVATPSCRGLPSASSCRDGDPLPAASRYPTAAAAVIDRYPPSQGPQQVPGWHALILISSGWNSFQIFDGEFAPDCSPSEFLIGTQCMQGSLPAMVLFSFILSWEQQTRLFA